MMNDNDYHDDDHEISMREQVKRILSYKKKANEKKQKANCSFGFIVSCEDHDQLLFVKIISYFCVIFHFFVQIQPNLLMKSSCLWKNTCVGINFTYYNISILQAALPLGERRTKKPQLATLLEKTFPGKSLCGISMHLIKQVL